MITKKKLCQAAEYLILAVISVLFLLIYSTSTSPLFDFHFGADSAFFLLVGEGMTKGMLPYRDFFDMKGPYLFLLEFLGQTIAYGKNGIFAIQCINLLLCLILIDRTFHIVLEDSPYAYFYKLLFLLPCAVIASVTFEGGNLTEEYSLPLLFLSLLFCVKYLQQSSHRNDHDHSPLIAGYYGTAFGIIAMIRITNAALIGAIILTISIDLLFRKKYLNLLWNGVAFIAGTIIAIIPAVAYCAYQGILSEMLNQVFAFGFQYSAEESVFDKFIILVNQNWPLLFSSLIPIIVLSVYQVKDWKYWTLSISSFFLLIVAVIMGNVYLHYFTLGIPNIVLGFVFLIEQLLSHNSLRANQWPLRKCLVLLLVVSVFAFQWDFIKDRSIDRAKSNIHAVIFHSAASQEDDILEIKSYIPEDDYDSVYAYGMSSCSSWYVQAELFPPIKYCDWQEHYIILNPQIGIELEEWIKSGSADWIVVPANYEIAPTQISNAIHNHYSVYAANDSYTLYILNTHELFSKEVT